MVRNTSWVILPFITGLLVVVADVEHAGLLRPIQAILSASDGNRMAMALVSVGVSATGTIMINNVPMTLVLASAVSSVQGPVGRVIVYRELIGCDFGHNLTTGSPLTMIQLLLLRRRGLAVSSRQYLRLEVMVTPAMLVATSLVLGFSV